MKYLYGASVQGIQGFIFATNRLREIVGASDIVEEIATVFFEKELLDKGGFDSQTNTHEQHSSIQA